MAQNIYDDPEFFAKYAQLPRSAQGLEVAYEWPIFRALLPELSGVHVLDLGCSAGTMARRLREMGAGLVLAYLAEPVPDDAFIATRPHLADETRRPPFLLVKAVKPAR